MPRINSLLKYWRLLSADDEIASSRLAYPIKRMNSRFSHICLELAEVFAMGTHFPQTFIFYIVTIELSTSIKTSLNIKGDKKQTKYLITQYADDTILTLADVLNSLTLIS